MLTKKSPEEVITIKGTNDWGRDIHRGDPAKAKAHDLTILLRRPERRKFKTASVKAFTVAAGR